jgi:hypothetical protein
MISGALALLFLASGAVKLARPREKLIASGMAFAADFRPGAVKAIGALEVLAAIGLIVPAAIGIGAWLSPLAAGGLVALMTGAIITHLRRHERRATVVNIVLLALSALAAAGHLVLAQS